MVEAKSLRPLFALAALVACLAAAATTTAGAYDLDKLYSYDFEATILTKVADDERPQYSGVALSSPMLVKRSGANELTVKLERPQLATFNEIIDGATGGGDNLPSSFKPNFKVIEQAGSLDKAFRIYYEEGGVKSFDTYKDEPKWVTNFKRGLLSYFQLKLQEPKATEASGASGGSGGSGSSSGSGNSDNIRQESGNGGHYYTTTEKSVFGECETDYLVLDTTTTDSSATPNYHLNVTKTRNMAKCKTRFFHRFMPIDSAECYDNERDLQQYKHSNAIFNYYLIGNRQDFSIKLATLNEVSTFSPFGLKAHSHMILTRSQLKLQKIDSTSGSNAQLSTEDGATRIESLSYDPPEMLNFYANVNLDEDHHLSNIYQSRASVEQVLSAFDALVQEHRAYTSAFEAQPAGTDQQQQQQQSQSPNYQENSNLAQLFTRLNELVGTLNSQKIEQLYQQVDDRGEAHKKIFWDLMSVVGTNPSFMFMKKLITEGEAPSVKIKDFLTRLSYHIKMPSKSLFDEYVNLCKSDKIQAQQQYKRLCSLPLASLIHQHCAKPHAKYLRTQQEGGTSTNPTAFKKAQNVCQIATAEEYFSRLVGPLGSGSIGSSSSTGGGVGSAGSSSSDGSSELSIGDKMFNIKMAGELGVKPTIDYLMEIVRNRDEHPSLRSAAMWNLNKVSRIYPAQVKRLVVPYYYDRGELLEVRIAAFYNWFYSGLALHELETLAKQLADEPSRQLVVYIHSMLNSMSELKDQIPCACGSVKNAKLVLPAIKEALKKHSYASLSDSRASMSSTWQPEFGYGTATLMSAIFSNESMAPSNLYYQTSEIMSGLKLSPMSVSVQAHGLDKLIKRVAGINGLLADKESFMDVFSLKRRSKRQAVVGADLIKQEAVEIDKELKLATREFSDIYMAITFSAYGRPIAFYDKDSRELKKMLSEDGTIKVPQIKKIIHSLNNHTQQQMMITFEKFEVFNNELGLPLYQSISDFDYKTFRLNSVKLDVEPGFFKDERQGKPPTKITAALDAKMGRHNEMFVSTGALLVNSRQQVGVGFHKKKLVNVPLKMAFDINLLENKVSIKRQPIHENLLYIKQQPVTFVRSYDPSGSLPSTTNLSQLEWRPLYEIHNTTHMQPFKLDYMTPLAVGFKLEGRHRMGEDWSMAAWRRHLASVGLQAAKFMYFYSPTGAPMELRLSTVTTAENPTKDLTSIISWRHQHPDEPQADNEALSIGPEMDQIHKDLESFTSKDQAGKPTTVDYRLALVGGSSKERRVGLDISYSRSLDKALHKWRVFYQRTPLDQSNSEVTNLCWLGHLAFPRIPVDKFLKFDLLNLDQVAKLSSDLTFGDECTESRVEEAPARLAMKANFEWTREQRMQIETALGGAAAKMPSSPPTSFDSDSNELQSHQTKQNLYKRMYQRCLRNREQSGAQLDTVCVHLLHKMSELNHISANITYKDVPERWTKMATRLGSLYTYARAGYIDEMDDKPSGRQYKSQDGKSDAAYLEANMTTSSYDRKISYQFDTSNYHVLYKNLPVSVPPLSNFPLLGASYYQMLQKRATSRFCSVSQNQVTTFDNLTYTMPQISDGCFKLITKDCSPESNFIVLGAKIGSGKVVKVYIAQKFKVEFVPDKDGKRISDIKVNGETVSIEANKLPMSRETKMGPKNVEAFSIENNGAYYTLNSKLYKFSVSTDGTWIFVQQSKYYAGKSCGICGDANGDHLLEFKSPSSSRKVCANTNDFVWSYVLPSTCASRPTNIECA